MKKEIKVIDNIPFADDTDGEDFFEYKKRVDQLAGRISDRYGVLKYDHIEEFKKITAERRQKAYEKSIQPTFWEKVKLSASSVSSLMASLDKRGIDLGIANSVNLLIRSTGVFEKTEIQNPKKMADINFENENRTLKWIKNRLKEKSTYAGIASIIALVFGADIGAGAIEPIAGAIVAIIVAYQVIMREKGSEKA